MTVEFQSLQQLIIYELPLLQILPPRVALKVIILQRFTWIYLAPTTKKKTKNKPWIGFVFTRDALRHKTIGYGNQWTYKRTNKNTKYAVQPQHPLPEQTCRLPHWCTAAGVSLKCQSSAGHCEHDVFVHSLHIPLCAQNMSLSVLATRWIRGREMRAQCKGSRSAVEYFGRREGGGGRMSYLWTSGSPHCSIFAPALPFSLVITTLSFHLLPLQYLFLLSGRETFPSWENTAAMIDLLL